MPALMVYFVALFLGLGWLLLLDHGSYRRDALARYAPDGRSIALVRRTVSQLELIDSGVGLVRGNLELWVMDADGRNRHRLWTSRSSSLLPAPPQWSVDQQVVCLCCREARHVGETEVVMADVVHRRVLLDEQVAGNAEPVGTDGRRVWLRSGTDNEAPLMGASRLDVLGVDRDGLPLEGRTFLDFAPRHIEDVWHVAPAPDGHVLAMSFSRPLRDEVVEDALAFVSPDGQQLREVPQLHGKLSRTMVWSPDSKRLLVFCGDTQVQEVDADSARVRLVTALPAGFSPARLVAFGPGGTAMLVANYQLYSLNLANGHCVRMADCSSLAAARPAPACIDYSTDLSHALLSDEASGPADCPEGGVVTSVDLRAGIACGVTGHSTRYDFQDSWPGRVVTTLHQRLQDWIK